MICTSSLLRPSMAQNRLAANYTCICGNKLTRGHISSCYDLPDNPIVCSLEPPYPSSPTVTSYNAIDHAVNVGDITAFRELLLIVTRHEDFVKRPTHDHLTNIIDSYPKNWFPLQLFL